MNNGMRGWTSVAIKRQDLGGRSIVYPLKISSAFPQVSLPFAQIATSKNNNTTTPRTYFIAITRTTCIYFENTFSI